MENSSAAYFYTRRFLNMRKRAFSCMFFGRPVKIYTTETGTVLFVSKSHLDHDLADRLGFIDQKTWHVYIVRVKHSEKTSGNSYLFSCAFK